MKLHQKVRIVTTSGAEIVGTVTALNAIGGLSTVELDCARKKHVIVFLPNVAHVEVVES